MTTIAYHASHEQFAPSELLSLSILAEQAGFGAIHSSDHFYPWSERQGQSGFAFSWLGAAMQATKLPFSMVCAPGQRYHPAIVAQAIATLEEMFPGRFDVALGSGEALNESITRDIWPSKEIRDARLKEAYEDISQLLSGMQVSSGKLVPTWRARLYTLPQRKPLLLGAATSMETAVWLAPWTDGIITVHQPLGELKKFVKAYRENGGEGKPMWLKVQLSYSHDDEAAFAGAWDQWRNNVITNEALADIDSVAEFDRKGELVTREDLEKMVHISADPAYHVSYIREYAALGFDRIVLHNVNREQELFIHDFGAKVLPAVGLEQS